MKATKLIFKLFLLSLVFVSCRNDDNGTPVQTLYENGVLISGQGSGAGSGSISYVSNDYKKVVNNIYALANNQKELGKFLQSLAFYDNKTYVVVDNTNSITVVGNTSFEEETKITEGLIGPKFMTVVGSKGYVTNSGTENSFVAIVDLKTNTVISKIDVTNGPEQIIHFKGKLFMTHTFSHDLVSVIDLNNDNKVTTITVAGSPDELFINSNNELVVLSEGKTLYDDSWNVIGLKPGAIQTINPSSNEIIKTIAFTEGVKVNLLMEYENDYYYTSGGKVYKISNSDNSLSTTPLFEATLSGMNIKGGKLFGVNAGSYDALSSLNVYDLSTNKSEFDTEVALGATKVYFVE